MKHWMAVVGLSFLTATLSAAEILTEEQIQAQIVGNTLEGVTADGHAWAEHYVENGRMWGLWKNKDPYSGRWRIKGSIFCVSYPEDPGSNWCNAMSLEGGTVTFHDKDTGVAEGNGATLLEGNAKNL